jgi:8-oxo-dGTP pyrophosphatase MutT (NUDIX family)
VAESTWSRAEVIARLDRFRPVRTRHAPSLHAASVAVCLMSRLSAGQPPLLVLTRRSPRLRAHAGQWALPGGRIEDGESAPDAARRELFEEVELAARPQDVLGTLDDYVSRSGYVITPVIIWLDDSARTPSVSAEVSEVHLIRVQDLDVEPRFIPIPESTRPVLQLPLLGRYIHAPTGAILHQFREVVMHGRPTRVAHYEQPVFAWK